MRRKIFDIAVVVAVTASAAASFFIIRDFAAKSEARTASAALERTASAIEEDVAARFAAAPRGGLFVSFASIDLSGMTVTPASLAGRVFARTDIRPGVFDASTLGRLKDALASGDAAAREAALSYYLDARPDSFALEKAVLYVHLMELKKAAGKVFDREYESVRNLLPAVSERSDRKFLAEKIRGLTSVPAEKRSAPLDDILAPEPTPGAGAEEFEGAGALAAALARDAVAKPAAVSIAGTTVGGRRRLMVSGPLGGGAYGAAFLDLGSLNAAIAAKYGASVCEKVPGGSYASAFRGGFFVAAPTAAFSGGLSPAAAAPYVPVLIIIAAFLYFRSREREAVKLSLAMTDFASRISHQLKTPLSSALLYLELAERHFAEGDQGKGREMIAAAGAQARSLSFLFENFSALNRIFSDGVRLFPEVVELKEELYKFFKAYSYDSENGKVAISVDIPDDLLVSVDRWAFYNILNNLVSNSMKYSPKTPVWITLSASCAPRSVVLSVADDGAGIPEADRGRIFEKFYKGSNAVSDQRSSGLGLYIASSLAARMGGSLRLAAGDGKGARFELELRRAVDGA